MDKVILFFKGVFVGYHNESKELMPLDDTAEDLKENKCALCNKAGVIRYNVTEDTQHAFCNDHIMLKDPRTRFSSQQPSLSDLAFLQAMYNAVLLYFYKTYHIHQLICSFKKPTNTTVLFEFADLFMCPIDFENIITLANALMDKARFSSDTFTSSFKSNRIACILFAYVVYFSYSKLEPTGHFSIGIYRLWVVCFHALYDLMFQHEQFLSEFELLCSISNHVSDVNMIIIEISSSEAMGSISKSV